MNKTVVERDRTAFSENVDESMDMKEGPENNVDANLRLDSNADLMAND